ncbi:MAG: biopolymer transporter ExbD [Spirochaetaceae bacterium]|jgi:biopolymer transport protein ExbD|nr:biopolymer transporter ExbD [Spirochaetaceae bacterium]
MIQIKKRRPAEDPMNSGSLTDLAFLLIIYFIVIAGFNVNKGYLLNLPEKDKPRIVQQEELMRISLDAQGNVFYQERALSEGELEETIIQQRLSYPETTLLLTVDPDTPYQEMVNIIHSIRRLRVENFSFRMTEEAP